MGDIGWEKLLIILVVVLVLFGAKRLPEIGRGLGKGMREFKDATKGLHDDVKSGVEGDKPEAPTRKDSADS